MFNTYKTFLLGTLACLTILCAIWCLNTKEQNTESLLADRDGYVTLAIFQQDVDHFSNDSRAMSPRDWGNPDSFSPQAMPEVTSEQPSMASTPPPLNLETPESQLVNDPRDTEFRPIEYGTVREPKNFYENQPLRIEGSNEPELNKSSPLPSNIGPVPSNSNPVPSNSGPLPLQTFPSPLNTSASYRSNPYFQEPSKQDLPKSKNLEQLPLKSRLEDYQGPANSQGISSDEVDNQRHQVAGPTYDEMVYGENRPYIESQLLSKSCGCSAGSTCSSCSQLESSQSNCYVYTPINPRQLRKQQRANSPRRGLCTKCRDPIGRRFGVKSISVGDQCGCQCASQYAGDNFDFRSSGNIVAMTEDCNARNNSELTGMQFNPSLGFRTDHVGDQYGESSAEVFPFEENEEYPSMREILAQSIYFAEADFMFLQPAFGGNSAISSGSAGNFSATPFNFDLEPAFRVMAGYESEFGPGLVGEYFQFDNNSDLASFTSDGTQTGETSVYQLGPNAWSRLVAANPGESIDALHSLEVHSTSVYAFKAIKFKRASVNGRFGLQLATIQQTLEANLTDGGGAVLGQLRSNTEVNAFGPRFGIDYFRKVGHTPIQLVASATGAILFGDRDQQVSNTTTGEVSSIGADEFITHFDIFFGLQMRQYRGEKRNTSFRLGFVNQSWIGGGTAIDPNDDFGFQGVSMTLGFNR